LDPLHKSFLGKIFDDLEFLIPVTNSSRVKSEQRDQSGLIGRIYKLSIAGKYLAIRDNPTEGTLSGQRKLCQEIWLCGENRVEVLL
jgi:hypothetical protein